MQTPLNSHEQCEGRCSLGMFIPEFLRLCEGQSMHISVGSMLARSTIQGMQEPQAVGRAEV